MGFKWERKGRSSKHIPFEWSGPLSFDMTLQVGICVYTDWQKWLYVIGIFSLGRYFNIYTNPQSGRGYRCDKSLGRQSILEVFAYFFPSFDSSIATLTSLFFLEYGQLSKMSFLFLLGIGKSGLSVLVPNIVSCL